jgi:hypothetical protein
MNLIKYCLAFRLGPILLFHTKIDGIKFTFLENRNKMQPIIVLNEVAQIHTAAIILMIVKGGEWSLMALYFY